MLVAIAAPMHTALRLALPAARRVKQLNPAAHVCFFGHYAFLNADHLLSGAGDSVIAGEAEPALVDLARAVLAGRPVEAVAGVGTRARRAAPLLERPSFVAPERSGLPGLDRYARLVRDGRETIAGYLEASRGCKHRCGHCPIVPVYGGRFVAVPLEVVLADARAQHAAGARHLTFGDPDFLNGPTHALRVARALHAELPDTSFDFTAKVEHLLAQRALLPELRDLGCAFVVSAVESLSDRVLAKLAKGHTAVDVDRLLDLMDEVGLALHPTLVPFTPWATLDDYLALLDFFERRGRAAHLPPVQLSIRLLLPPGSALLEEEQLRACLGPLDAEGLGWRWTHPDPRMDRLHESVAARVEADEAAGVPGARTWKAVRLLALSAAGRGIPDERGTVDEPMPPAFRPEPPRLTEHWFC